MTLRPQPSDVRRRPKDRKEQILQAARPLFVERGYNDVSMAQIAEAVGVTAGSLYRHYQNKAVLLTAVIKASFEEMVPQFNAAVTLDALLAEASRLAVSGRDVGVLWWRESPNLPAELNHVLREQLRGINGRYAEAIQRARPEVGEAEADLLAWSVQSVLASTSTHSTSLPQHELASWLHAACKALCAADLTTSPDKATNRRPRLEPASKRERLLGHAMALFGEHGYDATSLDDIGAAAGVTGPSLYSHFENKAEILEAVKERGTAALWLHLRGVLESSQDPSQALSRLVSGYVAMALDNTILTSLLLLGPTRMSNAELSRQREYVGEWTALLRSARPDLDERTSRLLVHSALGVVHSMARVQHRRNAPDFAAQLTAITTAVLLAS